MVYPVMPMRYATTILMVHEHDIRWQRRGTGMGIIGTIGSMHNAHTQPHSDFYASVVCVLYAAYICYDIYGILCYDI
jgi:hypothetical protein